MIRNSWVAEWLLSSQEELGSIDLVSYILIHDVLWDEATRQIYN
jgi:hypothetical protein